MQKESELLKLSSQNIEMKMVIESNQKHGEEMIANFKAKEQELV